MEGVSGGGCGVDGAAVMEQQHVITCQIFILYCIYSKSEHTHDYRINGQLPGSTEFLLIISHIC